MNSQLNTLTLPIVGMPDVAGIVKASASPLRVAITNVGPGIVLLAHDAGTLQASPAVANCYQLAETQERIIVLAPYQGLYAVGLGVGAQVSVAISESIPTKWMEA